MSKNRLPNLQLVQSDGRPAPDRQSGRVTHDSRGNAVWDWAIATGVLAGKTFDELITMLDEPGALSLDGEPEGASDSSGDPYNRFVR